MCVFTAAACPCVSLCLAIYFWYFIVLFGVCVLGLPFMAAFHIFNLLNIGVCGQVGPVCHSHIYRSKGRFPLLFSSNSYFFCVVLLYHICLSVFIFARA